MSQTTPFPATEEKFTDAQLIADSISDGSLFMAIYDRHSERIHRYLMRRFPAALAQDLAAETFATAFAKREQFDCTYADAAPWLFGIAANLGSRHRRREASAMRAIAKGRHDSVSFDGIDELVSRVDAVALARPLATALAILPVEQREALLLFAWGDLSYEEIAVALAVPIGTVRSRISRARAALRESLAGAGVSGFGQPVEEES